MKRAGPFNLITYNSSGKDAEREKIEYPIIFINDIIEDLFFSCNMEEI